MIPTCLTDFFNQSKIKEALAENDLDYCYTELYKNSSFYNGSFYDTTPAFTMMLLKSGINPLNYNLKAIYPYQFYKQTGFGSDLILSNNITWIGQYSFRGCTDITKLVVGQNVTNIRAGAFRECSEIEEVVIPDNVGAIGDLTFWDCINLKEVTIPERFNTPELLKHIFGENYQSINFTFI